MGQIGGSGSKGGLGGLPTPVLVLRAEIMHRTLLLLLAPQKWQLGFGLFVACYLPQLCMHELLSVPCSFFVREVNGNPLQHSCLENPMEGGAWCAAVHGVAKSWTQLSDFTFIFHFHALEKEMATHSSVLAWRIPGTGEPGGLPSMGLHRVGLD